MPRLRKPKCECAARLRRPREQGKRHPYWRGHVRLCRRNAYARVLFTTHVKAMKVCQECLERELLERSADVVTVELLEPRRDVPTRRAPEGAQLT